MLNTETTYHTDNGQVADRDPDQGSQRHHIGTKSGEEQEVEDKISFIIQFQE